MTRSWVNNDRIIIFGWITPLRFTVMKTTSWDDIFIFRITQSNGSQYIGTFISECIEHWVANSSNVLSVQHCVLDKCISLSLQGDISVIDCPVLTLQQWIIRAGLTKLEVPENQVPLLSAQPSPPPRYHRNRKFNSLRMTTVLQSAVMQVVQVCTSFLSSLACLRVPLSLQSVGGP